jgi:hypothetical protein
VVLLAVVAVLVQPLLVVLLLRHLLPLLLLPFSSDTPFVLEWTFHINPALVQPVWVPVSLLRPLLPVTILNLQAKKLSTYLSGFARHLQTRHR